MSSAFLQVCEAITADHLSSRHITIGNQAGLVGALGIVYIVYCLFIMAALEVLVVGHIGSKTAPNRESCYGRVNVLFERRSRAVAVSSAFK
jgi:hypothetical protein